MLQKWESYVEVTNADKKKRKKKKKKLRLLLMEEANSMSKLFQIDEEQKFSDNEN